MAVQLQKKARAVLCVPFLGGGGEVRFTLKISTTIDSYVPRARQVLCAFINCSKSTQNSILHACL